MLVRFLTADLEVERTDKNVRLTPESTTTQTPAKGGAVPQCSMHTPRTGWYTAHMPTDPGIQSQATAILNRMTLGDHSDSAVLSEFLYDELKSLARQMMNDERADHTLQPTALVHEVFLRLIRTDEIQINSKDHFMMLAAQVMRRVLIDHARAAQSQRRGGEHRRVSMTIADPESKEPISPETLLAIDDALDKLRTLDERKAKLVELRFFAGLDEEHAARILGISRSTASNDWRFARVWLLRELGAAPEDGS